MSEPDEETPGTVISKLTASVTGEVGQGTAEQPPPTDNNTETDKPWQ